MKTIIQRSVWLSIAGLVTIVLSLLSSNVISEEPQVAGKEKLVMGYVSDNPRKQYKKLKPLAIYVAGKLRDLGIKETEIRIARTQKEMAGLLKSGFVDWVSETPFGAALLMSEAGAQPILVRSKGGASEYYSLVFARADSGIDSLLDLKGKKIAFEGPGSTSAYYIPRLELFRAGLKYRLLTGHRQSPDNDKVGYLFSGSAQNSSAWVYRGVVDAAAVSSQDWYETQHIPVRHKGKYRIIFRSDPYPRAIELVGAHLSPELKTGIADILIKSVRDPAAASALDSYHHTTEFTPFTEAHLQMLDRISAENDLMGREQ